MRPASSFLFIQLSNSRPYYRRIIQLAVVDDDQRDIGNELEVLWGEKGARCKRIRAAVAKFPYNKHHERTGYSL